MTQIAILFVLAVKLNQINFLMVLSLQSNKLSLMEVSVEHKNCDAFYSRRMTKLNFSTSFFLERVIEQSTKNLLPVVLRLLFETKTATFHILAEKIKTKQNISIFQIQVR